MNLLNFNPETNNMKKYIIMSSNTKFLKVMLHCYFDVRSIAAGKVMPKKINDLNTYQMTDILQNKISFFLGNIF